MTKNKLFNAGKDNLNKAVSLSTGNIKVLLATGQCYLDCCDEEI